MAAPSLGLIWALAAIGQFGGVEGVAPRRGPLIVSGADPARGVLVNVARGARPTDPIDPGRPTLVFVHGINPAPGLVHFGMGRSVGEALATRPGGPGINALEWDWNAATIVGLRHRANSEAAIAQGRALAHALRSAGVDPGRLHLVGHSAGGMVAASAAHELFERGGGTVAQVTLLESAGFYHDVLFEEIRAVGSAARVENYWAPGPGGFGGPARVAGVVDVPVYVHAPLSGAVRPSRSGHLAIVRWYVGTVADPSLPLGFNTSLLLAQP